MEALFSVSQVRLVQVSCESHAHRENGSGNRTPGVRLGHLTMLSLALTCYNRNMLGLLVVGGSSKQHMAST